MDNGINKQQSKIIKGVAILLMIYHHLFVLAGEGMYGDSILFLNTKPVTIMAYFGKICVGLFAFISGYAIRRAFFIIREKTNKEDVRSFIILEYKYAISHIIRLYLYYWLVLIIFVPMLTLLGKISPEALHCNNILSNLLCINTDYDGSVWYISFYLVMLLIAPMMDLFFTKSLGKRYTKKKMKVLTLGLVAAIVVIALAIYKEKNILAGLRDVISLIKPSFALCFISGYLFSRYEIYELIHKVLLQRLNGVLSLILGLFLILITFTIRALLADSAAYAELDFIIVPFFILGILTFVKPFKYVGKCLSYIGDQQTFMWLTHIHIVGMFQTTILTVIHKSIIYYLAILLLSLVVSIVLTSLCRQLSSTSTDSNT